MPDVSELSHCGTITTEHIRPCCDGGCQYWTTLSCNYAANCICTVPFKYIELVSICTNTGECSTPTQDCTQNTCTVFSTNGYNVTLYSCPGSQYSSAIAPTVTVQGGDHPGFGQLIPGLTFTVKCSTYTNVTGSCSSGSYIDCACLTRNTSMFKNITAHLTYAKMNQMDLGSDDFLCTETLTELDVEYPYSRGIGGFVEFIGPNYRTISTGSVSPTAEPHIVAIGGWSGGVYATGNNAYGQCNVPEFLRDPTRISGAIQVSANNKNSACLFISQYAEVPSTLNLIKNVSRMHLGITGWGDNTFNQLPVPTSYTIARGITTDGFMLLGGFTGCTLAHGDSTTYVTRSANDAAAGVSYYACFHPTGITQTLATNYTRITSGKYNTAAAYDNSHIRVNILSETEFDFTPINSIGVECWGDIGTISIPGVSMNDCGVLHSGPGCTCNGNPGCNPSDCAACVAYMTYFDGGLCVDDWNNAQSNPKCWETANDRWNVGVAANNHPALTVGGTLYPENVAIPPHVLCGTTGPVTSQGNTYTPCYDNQIKYINECIIPDILGDNTGYISSLSCGTTHCCAIFGAYLDDTTENNKYLYCWGLDGTTASLDNMLTPSRGSTMHAWNTNYGVGNKRQQGLFIKENGTTFESRGTSWNPLPQFALGNYTISTSATITLVKGLTNESLGITYDLIQHLGVIHNATSVCGSLRGGAYDSELRGSWEWISCGDTNTCACLSCAKTVIIPIVSLVSTKHFLCWGISGDTNNITPHAGSTFAIIENIRGTTFEVYYAPCQVEAGNPPIFYYRSAPFTVGNASATGDLLITAKALYKVGSGFDTYDTYGDIIENYSDTARYLKPNATVHNSNSLLSNRGVAPGRNINETPNTWNQYFSETEQMFGKRPSDTNWTPYLPLIANDGTRATYLANRYIPSPNSTCIVSATPPTTNCCTTSSSPTIMVGACWTTNECIDNVTALACETSGGVFLGFDTDTGDCPS